MHCANFTISESMATVKIDSSGLIERCQRQVSQITNDRSTLSETVISSQCYENHFFNSRRFFYASTTTLVH
ncbi:unnamed protein product [Leptosia nina]|uniref:Uncharacterized protein n=1 Tax=Leptosia nina TaxID=320188 RepID=A0AAV1JPM8_9NEOP